jgi:hypothetical protein
MIIVGSVDAGKAVGIAASLPQDEQRIWSPLLSFVIGNEVCSFNVSCCYCDDSCFSTASYSILPKNMILLTPVFVGAKNGDKSITYSMTYVSDSVDFPENMRWKSDILLWLHLGLTSTISAIFFAIPPTHKVTSSRSQKSKMS